MSGVHQEVLTGGKDEVIKSGLKVSNAILCSEAPYHTYPSQKKAKLMQRGMWCILRGTGSLSVTGCWVEREVGGEGVGKGRWEEG